MSDFKYSSFFSYYGRSNFFAYQADNIFPEGNICLSNNLLNSKQ